MRSIKANYEKVRDSNPNLGDCICLAKAVIGKKYSRKAILKAFNVFVPLVDFEAKEKKGLIDHLDNLSNGLREA